MTIVPDYYFDFRCVAGECRHSCCAGWEVDIDPVSLEKRIAFVQYCVGKVLDAWDESEDQSDEALFEIARSFSAEIEYNETRKNELIEEQ